MGKVLIAAFDDKDEIAFDELLLFLKSKALWLYGTFLIDMWQEQAAQ